jgi:hypothetical protein
MTMATIEDLTVRPEVNRAEPAARVVIELRPPFSGILAPQTHLLLGRLLDARLRIVEPFVVSLSSENGQFLAEAQEVGEIGAGGTQSEAIQDLQATLGELFVVLDLDRDRLGADMAKVWAVMQRKVIKKA